MRLFSYQHFNIAQDFWNLGHSFLLLDSNWQHMPDVVKLLWLHPEQLQGSPKRIGWAHQHSPLTFSLLGLLASHQALKIHYWSKEVTKASVIVTCFHYWNVTFSPWNIVEKAGTTEWNHIIPSKCLSQVSLTIRGMYFAEATLQLNCTVHVFSLETKEKLPISLQRWGFSNSYHKYSFSYSNRTTDTWKTEALCITFGTSKLEGKNNTPAPPPQSFLCGKK